MGEELRLPLDNGWALTLWATDDGYVRYKIEHPVAPEPAFPIGGKVADDLGLARLALWSRSALRGDR